MFARPRPKKSALPPPPKKRKAESAVEEVNFDFDARQDYLTGFHKRKLQRVKFAQEQAAKKAREEKIEMRKQVKQERQKEVEEHVKAVNALLQEAQAADSDNDQEISDFEEWDGIEDQGKEQAAQTDIVDYEDEYIDEDRYTTVKVEAIAVTRDGLEKLNQDSDEEANDENKDKTENPAADKPAAKKKTFKDRPKKPKFRYESKLERQVGDRKLKAKKKAKFKK
ncbi:Ribosomal RNA-processing protein 17 [Colletotrichum aenigma]|uniref:Ribosomal RNA-processing protein 17 n=1 Tax=Colletotrichum aenigma TaxID=1215731 RepID=UPI001872CA78|nr:Ribosomal RNA-processing protein 17 [Colletotrichum aenigma]KAF5523438.1 Ribosomal RNA-processing protein 17 [Colletotrichum aenigma]